MVLDPMSPLAGPFVELREGLPCGGNLGPVAVAFLSLHSWDAPRMVLTPGFERQMVDAARDAGVDRLVAGAVVVRKGGILLLRRKHGDFMGGLYELPSGVIEPGETLEEALYPGGD